MNITDFLEEISTMSRADLIAAKNDLSTDTELELPKQVRGQLVNAINNRLSALKNKPKQQESGGFFYSFMAEGQAISAISKLSVGEFIIEGEPDALISVFPLSAEQFEKMVEKDWPSIWFLWKLQ